MKKLITEIYRMRSIMGLTETVQQDRALDSLSEVGSFDKLSELDKLALLGPGGDVTKLMSLDLQKIHDQRKTFGQYEIKVRVKNEVDQKSKHKFSLAQAGQEGYLLPKLLFSNKNVPYAMVRFLDYYPDAEMTGKGGYDEYPITLDNLYPIDYTDSYEKFNKHDNHVSFEVEDKPDPDQEMAQ